MPKLADAGSAPLGESSTPTPAGGACYLKICGVVESAGCPVSIEAPPGPRPLYIRYDVMPNSISVCACGGVDGPTRDPVFGTWSFWPLWRVEQGCFSEHAQRAFSAPRTSSAEGERGVVGSALDLLPEEVRSLLTRCLKEGRHVSIALNFRARRDPFDAVSEAAISSLEEAARSWGASLTITEFPPLEKDPLIGDVARR